MEAGESSHTDKDTGTVDRVKQRLTKRTRLIFSGEAEHTISPADLDIPAENSEAIVASFSRRITEETDISEIVDGIMPPESLFDPDVPTHLTTQYGEVRIKNVKETRRRLYNKLRSRIIGNAAGSLYQPLTRTISVTPELDDFSTVVAAARGDFEKVVGIGLAHEGTHAFQDGNPEIIKRKKNASIKSIRSRRSEEGGLSFMEASILDVRSRDKAILEESQAVILQLMISGGYVPPEIIQEYRKTTPEHYTVDGFPLSLYSTDGYAPISDLVISQVKNYLPKKDQENDEYLNRIKVASIQVIKCLDVGLSHRQIAELMSSNYQSIQDGNEWDQEEKGYRFLQEAIEQRGGVTISDQDLLTKFDKQKNARASQISTIALEELAKRTNQSIPQ